MSPATPRTGYAPAGDLEMYYEVHGSGRPLVLLHGAYMTVEGFGPLLARLAEGRQVIVPEMQGHGRTADLDRPIAYEQMADCVAALIDHLGVGPADVFGYSMGAGIALQLAMRHPDALRRLVCASISYAHDGMQPELLAFLPDISPEMFAGSPMETAYKEVAPSPDDFPTLVAKLKALDLTPYAWSPDAIRAIAAPTLLIVGDSDAIRLEHVVELYRLLGGGAMGDLAGVPRSHLAVLPGTTHFVPPGSGVLDRVDWLMAMVPAFLDS